MLEEGEEEGREQDNRRGLREGGGGRGQEKVGKEGGEDDRGRMSIWSICCLGWLSCPAPKRHIIPNPFLPSAHDKPSISCSQRSRECKKNMQLS